MSSNAHARITWWGHATVMIDDGARVLTDPILTPWFAHLVRLRGETPDISHTPPDLVVISHLHSDHYHVPSLRLLPEGTRVAVPAGGGRLLKSVSVDVQEVDVGDVLELGDTSVTVVPALHNGKRWHGSRFVAPTLGYLVEGSRSTYFAGDTDLFDGLSDIREQTGGGPDAALLPVWGWGPWLRGDHLDPRSAVDALEMIGARLAIPIHWGTFWPRGMSLVRQHIFEGAGDRFAEHVAERHPEVDVRVLWPGSSTVLPGR
jgi:L-ascorbate metabolism protein UlaG (beta-lactamase superfamily)